MHFGDLKCRDHVKDNIHKLFVVETKNGAFLKAFWHIYKIAFQRFFAFTKR